MRSFICLSIAAKSVKELISIARETEKFVDLFEIRLDYLEDKNEIFDIRMPCQTIFTFRHKREGGLYYGDEAERLNFLLRIAKAFPNSYIDLEHDVPKEFFYEINKSCSTICSYHEFDEEWDIDKIIKMLDKPAEIFKIALMAKTINKVFRAIDILNSLKQQGKSVNLVIMGKQGQWTRILASFFKLPWTYISYSPQTQTAPGQISFNHAVKIYRLNNVDMSYSVYGIIGSPLDHSISPIIHNIAFKELSYKAIYVPFDIDDLKLFMQKINKLIPLRGLSVTIPYKTTILSYIDQVDEDAIKIGAVNTLKYKESKWIGYNTDWIGFIKPLLNVVNPNKLKVLVLGAGGAAASVIYALKKHGAKVAITNRNNIKAVELANKFYIDFVPWDQKDSYDFDILVNATPAGMYPQEASKPIELKSFEAKIIYDLVYNPLETELLKEAKAKGAITINGLDMLIEQAVDQLKIWIGNSPPKHMLKEVANAYLQDLFFYLF
jgi:3-dehydroquinate dehydratase/shikimate dehydrogenase